MANVNPQARLVEIIELLAAWGELEMRKNRMLARPLAEGEARWSANDGSSRAKEWTALCNESPFCGRDAEEWADELNTLLKTNCIRHGDCVEHPDTIGKACARRATEMKKQPKADSQESRQRAKHE